MILDSIENSEKYIALHPAFKKVFDYLKKTDLKAEQAKHIELDEKNIYINFDVNAPKTTAQLEAHRRYIDIQMPLSGVEQMGWKPTRFCEKIAQPYDAERDIEFFADEYDTKFSVKLGEFVIFFPEDAHAPALSEVELRKLVVKIKI